MDEIEPKFGEWLRGIYASESNPRRDGMYVRTIHRKGRMNPGKFYELTDGNGAFWMYPAQSVERIAAALRSAQVPEWRPIETAPEGSWLLAHSERGWIGVVRRADPDYAPDEGWFEDEHGEYVHPAWLTHWMPLPAAPTVSAEGDR